MTKPLMAVAVIFLIVILAEYMWRKKKLSTEISRKAVHIFVASFVAFWPLFMTWFAIEIISMAFLAVILLSRHLSIFKSIHSVERNTWGEVFFALSILILSVWFRNNWIFAVALLHLGLADGLAAIVGTHYGKGNDYYIFGHKKTIVGSLSFFIASTIIIGLVAVWWGGVVWYTILWLPMAATLTENIGVQGTDDLFVPLVLAIILSTF
jgi:phytol kinase